MDKKEQGEIVYIDGDPVSREQFDKAYPPELFGSKPELSFKEELESRDLAVDAERLCTCPKCGIQTIPMFKGNPFTYFCSWCRKESGVREWLDKPKAESAEQV